MVAWVLVACIFGDLQMDARNYDDNEYRRNPQFARNESGDGGGDYAYPPRIYGRDFCAPQDRYPQRVEHGYRDSAHLSRGGSGDAFRGYEGQGNNGYGADGRAGQGYLEGGYAPGGWVSDQGFRGDRREQAPKNQWGPAMMTAKSNTDTVAVLSKCTRAHAVFSRIITSGGTNS